MAEAAFSLSNIHYEAGGKSILRDVTLTLPEGGISAHYWPQWLWEKYVAFTTGRPECSCWW